MLTLCAVWMASQTVATPDPVAFSAPIAVELRKEWPTNRTFTIVCHGHSVPAGYFKTPTVQTFDAYPSLLHRTICKQYPHAVVNVIVTAIGGENSVQGAARFERDVMSLHPDVVTIDYALNDRGIGLEAAKKAWSRMIESAQKGGSKVILLTPSWDTSVHPEDPADPLAQHAAQIRSLASQYKVGLADSLAAFLAEQKRGVAMDSLMAQFNHPNRQGHELITRQLLPWFGVLNGG